MIFSVGKMMLDLNMNYLNYNIIDKLPIEVIIDLEKKIQYAQKSI